MNIDNWQQYQHASYELVKSAVEDLSINVSDELEYQCVRILTKHWTNDPIDDPALCLQIANRSRPLVDIGDDCLLIHSWPLKSQKWPSKTYYLDLSVLAYNLCGNNLLASQASKASNLLKWCLTRREFNV